MLNPGAVGRSGALYDLLKSADNSPRCGVLDAYMHGTCTGSGMDSPLGTRPGSSAISQASRL